MLDPSQPETVHAAIQGDAAAFDAIIGPLITPGYQLALAMLSDREAARDALQEATFKAWLKLHQLRNEMLLRPWFLAMVANECRSMRRGKWWSIVRLADLGPQHPNPEDDAIRNADLLRGLQKLSRDDRLALFLFFYLDLSLMEVGQILNLRVPAAKSRIYRAVAKLRPRLSIQEVFP